MLQHYITNPKVHALSSCPITHPHVFSIRPPCFLHVLWCHTLNLRCTCAHHVYTMRNSCLLTSSPNPNFISRLFPILLDPKSFQTALDSVTWLPGHVLISYLFVCCRLILYYCTISVLTLTLVQSLSILSSYNTIHQKLLVKFSSNSYEILILSNDLVYY